MAEHILINLVHAIEPYDVAIVVGAVVVFWLWVS